MQISQSLTQFHWIRVFCPFSSSRSKFDFLSNPFGLTVITVRDDHFAEKKPVNFCLNANMTFSAIIFRLKQSLTILKGFSRKKKPSFVLSRDEKFTSTLQVIIQVREFEENRNHLQGNMVCHVLYDAFNKKSVFPQFGRAFLDYKLVGKPGENYWNI